MKFWPFPIIRAHLTTQIVTDLFLLLADQPDLEVRRRNGAELALECQLGQVSFWNGDRYTAWAQFGRWEPHRNFWGFGSVLSGSGLNLPMHWEDQLPSRYAVRAMRQRLVRIDPTGPWA